MKVLTLTQPWATLVAIGAKRIETRAWKTNYRGPLAIHAAKGFPSWAKKLVHEEPFITALENAKITNRLRSAYLQLPVGCIVATCELIDCIYISGCPVAVHVERMGFTVDCHIPPGEPELSFGNYSSGRYAWLLANIEMVPSPIPMRGALGLWEWKENDE